MSALMTVAPLDSLCGAAHAAERCARDHAAIVKGYMCCRIGATSLTGSLIGSPTGSEGFRTLR